jgi:hypothetical protein
VAVNEPVVVLSKTRTNFGFSQNEQERSIFASSLVQFAFDMVYEQAFPPPTKLEPARINSSSRVFLGGISHGRS